MKRYLTEPQQRQLAAVPKAIADPLAQRDYHCIEALRLTGMRIEEWSLLTAPLVRMALQVGWLVSPKEHCKGKHRPNEYMVTHALRAHLAWLLKLSDEIALTVALDDDQVQPLVWGRIVDGRAGALSVRSYEARLKEWAVRAGIDARFSPHWLRHTRGMNIMRRSRGKDAILVAQRALNHASIRSTQVYTQMSREEFEAQICLVDGGRVPRRVARELVERAS